MIFTGQDLKNILRFIYLPLPEMIKIDELRAANIGRMMYIYLVPAFVGVFVNALYNIVDRIFIGQGIGAEALSGISVIFPLLFILPEFWGITGIWSAYPVSDSMAALAVSIFLIREWRRLPFLARENLTG